MGEFDRVRSDLIGHRCRRSTKMIEMATEYRKVVAQDKGFGASLTDGQKVSYDVGQDRYTGRRKVEG